jgi:hypothetical protein
MILAGGLRTWADAGDIRILVAFGTRSRGVLSHLLLLGLLLLMSLPGDFLLSLRE